RRHRLRPLRGARRSDLARDPGDRGRPRPARAGVHPRPAARRVQTFERLLPADTDNARDAYAVVPAPPVSAPPAPGPPRPAPAPPAATPAFPAAPPAPGRPDDDAARRRTRPRPVAARLLSRRPSRPGVVRVRVACPRGAGVRRCRGTVR